MNPSTNSPLLLGTGLQAGRQYGYRLVGYEWDRIFANGASACHEGIGSPLSLKWIMKYVDWKSSVLACTMTIILAVIAEERYF